MNRRFYHALIVVVIASGLTAVVAVEAPRTAGGLASPDAGVVPTDAEGKPLNLGFETGTLNDWTATGDAFKGQPIHGDTVAPRRHGQKSNHAGEWWVGTYEVGLDKPQGTLTSVAFKVTHPWASFLVGGGTSNTTRVEVVRAGDKTVIYKASGHDAEEMTRVAVDLHAEVGNDIFIRVVDEASGPWGHINFDDFRFHDTAPKVAKDVVAAVSNLPADTVKYAGLSPEDAAKAITLPPGFKATLFAGEPDVVQPIALAIDDRGRIWVAEAMTYPKKAPDGQGKDRILIFEDKGDGHFKKRTVFMEGLNLVSGLEVGFGGVWVGAAPQLLFIPILEGDKPGEPQVVLDGFGHHDTHETLNSFTWGPDGYLYGCHGVFTHSMVGKPGAPDAERVPMNAAVWRYQPVKKTFEIFAEGGSNQWGLDWDDEGQAFITACVIPHLYHVFPGGRYQRQAGQHFEPYTYQDIKTIADHVHWAGGGSPHSGNGKSDSAGGGHAHCGAMVYLGDNWPAEYRNSIYMSNIHGNRVNNDILEPSGSGYVGHHGKDFMLMNDKWSRLISMKYGPDGGVYVIDWYDKQACHLPKPEVWDRGNGRIYKITYGDPKPAQVDLAKLGSDELVKLQLSSNDWYVRHARRILRERGANPALLQSLEAIATQQPDAGRRLRGLWALAATGNLSDAKMWSAFLEDKSPYVRGWAIQLAAQDPGLTTALLDRARSLAADTSAVVRLYLAGAMQRMPLDQRWDTLEALALHAEDANDHNLPVMYWYAIDPLVPADANRAANLAANTKIPLLRQFIAQRLASLPQNPAGLAAIVKTLGTAQVDAQADILKGIGEGLAGKRSVAMPEGWAAVSDKLEEGANPDIRQRVESLSTLFGDPRALARLRQAAQDPSADISKRESALEALLAAKDAQLAPILQKLLDDPKLRGSALRGLAAYDDVATPHLILGIYGKLDGAEKRDALNTLASRPAYAKQLLAALKNNTIPKSDLTAPTVRNLSSLDDPAINAWIAESWGTVRATADDKKKEIARLKAIVGPEALSHSDATNGRALFNKTCQQCHTLFGIGAKIGPDLTGSNRADVNYLLDNIVDPSAVIGKDYLLWMLRTKDGRAIDGVIKSQNDESVTIATTTELLTLPRSEIERMKVSTVSMMPEGLLSGLSEKEVRDLFAYLRSSTQTPMLATAENQKLFFDGKSLAYWDVDPSLWQVENGELVGRTATGVKRNNFAFNELVLGDFRMVFEVKLVPNSANSGVQFRSQPRADGEAIGYQADIGAGWWGKIYEESGRGLLAKEGGEKFVKPNEWNIYEILAVGSHIRLAINGHVCSDIQDPDGAKRGQTGIQIHAGGKTEVHYRNFDLQIGPKDEMKTVQ